MSDDVIDLRTCRSCGHGASKCLCGPDGDADREHSFTGVEETPAPPAVAVTYPIDEDMLRMILEPLTAMPASEWDAYAGRTGRLGGIAAQCTGLDGRDAAEFGAFVNPYGLVTVVLWTTPIVVVTEMGFTVSPQKPERASRPILGPDGSRLN